MKKIIVLCGLILSCGGEMTKEECPGDWYYEDVAGLTICSDGKVDPDEIRYAVQVIEQQTAIRYPEVNNLAELLKEKKVSVYFIDEALAVNCEPVENGVYRCDKDIGGANVDGHRIYVRYNSCLAFTSLGHEILHSIEKYYLNIPDDVDHTVPWLFEIGNPGHQTETVEYKIFLDLYFNVASCQ